MGGSVRLILGRCEMVMHIDAARIAAVFLR